MSEINFSDHYSLNDSKSEKQKDQREREREKSTVIVYKRKKKKQENKKRNQRLSTYQDFDGLLNSLERNFWVIALIGVRDVD